MKPVPFDYHRPATIEEAVRLTSDHGRGAAILAGGQSLIPMLNRRIAKPSLLIDIKRLSPLEQIVIDRDRLIIGALMRHADVIQSEMVQSYAPLLAEALGYIAHPAIRNRGTLGGSLAFADPAAEIPACAVCFDADIVAASIRGERHIPAAEFFTGPHATTLDKDEIILRVEFPLPASPWICMFDEIARRQNDVAIAGLGFAARVDAGSIRECRIVFCGVESSPRRMTEAEAYFVGAERHSLTSAVREAQRVVAERLVSLDSAEYPSGYRPHLAGVLLQRAIARLERVMDVPQ
jgi:carbon-monoxide dehydrogenase medium subunit